MGLAGASAGAVSGVIVEAWGYSTLTLLAALATAPLVVLVSVSKDRAATTAPAASPTAGAPRP
jgi:hypothetical protein